MKTKSTATGFVLCLTGFATFLFSCQKEPATSKITDQNISNSVESLKAHLAAWYKFTKGNTADFSGNNNHLTGYNVTSATDYLGRPKNAFYFDGSTSYMTALNSPSLNPSSISLVVLIKPMGYYTGFPPTSRILMKGVDDQSSGDYFMGLNNTGSFYGTFGDNQFQSNSINSADNLIQLNNWYKLVYTYDAGVGKLYKNDTLVGKSKQVATFTANTDYLRIGTTGRPDYPYWFNGVIDEIRIYNVALTAAQVANVDADLGQ